MSKDTKPRDDYTVLKEHMGGGPKGLGDPDSRAMRVLESDVIIPRRLKKLAKEMCSKEVQVFSECGKAAGLMLAFTCRKENQAMKQCLYDRFVDPELMLRCKEEYLAQRSEYRRTGIAQKMQKKESMIP